MKNSKQVFWLIAIAVVLLVVGLMALSPGMPSDPQETTEDPYALPTIYATDPPEEPLLPATAPEDVVLPEIPTEPEYEIRVSDNVTIYQVEKDPNEVIDRTATVDPSHPEYQDVVGGDPYWSVEGKVCRNDRTISIEIEDTSREQTYTISFGYITGGCNRFLYLNPVMTWGDLGEQPCYIHLDKPIGGGQLVTLPGADPADEDPFALNRSYTFRRAYVDHRQNARYVDSKHPGAVWFPQDELDGPILLDMIVANAEGNFSACLRLVIDKAEDGTYSFVDIDNLDLTQDNAQHPEYTEEELRYVTTLARDVYMNQELSQLAATEKENTPGLCYENVLITYRDHTNGLYFGQFVVPGGASSYTKVYSDQRLPILAVTYRRKGLTSLTFYFQVTEEPNSSQHGTYRYIGRDYTIYDRESTLKGYGWDGVS